MANPHSTLRKWLSYLAPQTVESIHSTYSGQLEVVLSEGRYMLNSPTATYSFEDKYTSFRQAIQHIQDDLPAYNSALVLGLGLGSVPFMLRNMFGFQGQITCVEIDPVVIKLAAHYYPQSNDFQHFKIIEADAIQWLAEDNPRFDLIIVDIFEDTRIPVGLHDKQKLQQLRNHLAPGGTLLFSRLTGSKRFETRLWDNLQAVFPEGDDIDTGGNVILRYKAKK